MNTFYKQKNLMSHLSQHRTTFYFSPMHLLPLSEPGRTLECAKCVFFLETFSQSADEANRVQIYCPTACEPQKQQLEPAGVEP